MLLLVVASACARGGFEPWATLGDAGGGDVRGAITGGDTAGGEPAAGSLAISPSTVTMNVNSWRTFVASGGTPPYTYSVLSGSDLSGESLLNPATGLYRSGNVRGSFVIRVIDAASSVADAAVEVGGGSMVLLGGAGSPSGPPTTYDTVYSTSDGASWTLVGHLPGNREDGTPIVFDDKLWYLGGYDGTVTHDNVWYTSDGQNWLSSGGVLPRNLDTGVAVVHQGQLVYLGGSPDDGGTALDEVLASSDGVSWTQIGTLPAPRMGPVVTTLGGRIWLGGGVDSESEGRIKPLPARRLRQSPTVHRLPPPSLRPSRHDSPRLATHS